VVVARAGKRTPVGTVAVEVVPDGRRLTRAQRTAPVIAGCYGSSTPFSGPSPLAGLAAPLAVSGTADPSPHGRSKSIERPVTLGPSFRPPQLLATGGGRGTGLAEILLYIGIAIGSGVLLVELVRVFRDAWTP
jgi:hypothetical protein